VAEASSFAQLLCASEKTECPLDLKSNGERCATAAPLVDHDRLDALLKGEFDDRGLASAKIGAREAIERLAQWGEPNPGW